MTLTTGDRHFDDDALADLVADVTDEFVERVERGESPEVEEYAQRYPEIADVLRNVLPALTAMRGDTPERSGTGSGSLVGAMSEIDGELGDFRIIREIGRGGMGIVYEAEQQSLRRRVALKVLPFAAAMDARRLERFRNEAAAAARLHHANIVPVHSVGSDRGVYYYAMQIIDGETLADVIHAMRQSRRSDSEAVSDAGPHVTLPRTRTYHAGESSDASGFAVKSSGDSDHDGKPIHPLAGVGATDLANKARAQRDTQTYAGISTDYRQTHSTSYVQTVVEIAIQAAEALEHAHSFDVVHRDIKPANLMIDARGHLWITDFGLARIRTETGVTVSGDFVGTFLYSSPEQVLGRAGAVDSRSDIYSLGATVYELLTLEPVVGSVSREKIIYEIAHEEPVAPRKHNSSIPADLETILLKSLSKDPALRYQTAQAFADDMRRFLDDRPILAKRPTLVQTAAKWMRRHMAVVVSGMLALLVAVVALGVSIVLIARQQILTSDAYEDLAWEQIVTKSALDAERNAHEAAEAQRLLAERNLSQARDMLQFFMEIAENDLADDPQHQDLRIRMLDASLDYYRDFIELSADNPPLRAEMAEAHLNIARILYYVGSAPAAMDALEKALETQEELVRESPDDRSVRHRLTSMYFQLGVFSGRNELMLICQSSVQKHLGLNREQVAEVENLRTEQSDWRQLFDGMSDVTADRREYQNETERLNTRLRELLSDEQAARLKQISLQERGSRAFSDPAVAAMLELTSAQRVEIRTIQKEGFDANRRRFDRVRRGDAPDEFYSVRDRVTAVLTPDQLKRWNDETGKKFEGRIHRWPYHQSSRKSRWGSRSSRSRSTN